MPLPLVLGIIAAAAAAGGVSSGVVGAVKMKEANDTMKSAETRHKENIARFENQNKLTAKSMDELGAKEIAILATFEKFSNLFEQIQNRPEFKECKINGVELPKYDAAELKKVSVGAGVLMGGIGGAALGTAGGFAAAGATTAAVMALGTASTGTAIASLSGVAATNATLAALGGGALAAGGGGIALGTTVLGAATAGVGLLIGGVIFNIVGSSIAGKADKAWAEMWKAEAQINKICTYLGELRTTAIDYLKTLTGVEKIYMAHLEALEHIVVVKMKTDWMTYTDEEKLIVENSVLLVGLLYKMCKVQLVLKSDSETEVNQVNHDAVIESSILAGEMLSNKRFDLSTQSSSEAMTNHYASNEVKSLDDNTSKSSMKPAGRTVTDSRFTDDENYYIAVVAVLNFFARCDGNLSEVEYNILINTVNSLKNEVQFSANASREISIIMATGNITFYQVQLYLDRVSQDKLFDFNTIIETVINASDGITDAELKAHEMFNEYYLKRKNMVE